MPSPLVRALHEKHGLALIDATNVDAFLAAPGPALMLFAGDPKQRMESNDVAVVLPELSRHFGGRYRGAVVALDAEDGLKARFQVVMQPSLVVARGDDVLDVITKIRDWSEYVERLGAALAPDAAALPRSGKLNTQMRVNGARVDA